MKIIRVSQQGYCSGVSRALNIVEKTVRENNNQRQIYILGNIINNTYVSNQLKKQNVITINSNGKKRIDMLSEINNGIVILTAHGVSPEVYKYLENNNIEYIDATCPFVRRVSDRVTSALQGDYQVIYIGKHNHPESEGITGIDNSNIHLVSNIDEVNKLNIEPSKIFIDTQTTLSDFYTKPIIDAILLKYPSSEIASGICDATTVRQQALIDEIQGELCLIVGDKISSNANELLRIASKYTKSYLINHVSEIKEEWLTDVNTITLTSAASTPKSLTNEIFNYLETL